MNLFWPSLGVWAYFSHKARQEKKKEDAIYDRAIRDAVEEHFVTPRGAPRRIVRHVDVEVRLNKVLPHRIVEAVRAAEIVLRVGVEEERDEEGGVHPDLALDHRHTIVLRQLCRQVLQRDELARKAATDLLILPVVVLSTRIDADAARVAAPVPFVPTAPVRSVHAAAARHVEHFEHQL